jgi:hypothetical protein
MQRRANAWSVKLARPRNLNHPHICLLHDIGEDRGIGYLVMDLEGESLAARLRRWATPSK